MLSRREKFAKREAIAQDRMETVLLPTVKTVYPQAEMSRNGGISISLHKDTENSSFLSIIIYRDHISSGYSIHDKAVRVGFSSSAGWNEESKFKKSFGGKRLRKDILDEKFNVETVLKQITKVKEWFDEQLIIQKQIKENNDRRDVRLARLQEHMILSAGSVGWDIDSSKNVVRSSDYSTTITETPHNGEDMVNLGFHKVIPMDLALKILNLIHEETNG
jgi:hypothetical protein